MAGTLNNFTAFAGNAEMKDGIAPGMPLINLESVQDPTVIENLKVLGSVMPAKGETIFLTPRIFGDRFDWIQRSNMPYGAFAELAMFKNSPPIRKRDGKCISFGDAQLYAEQWVSNWAYNITITLKDREINKGVMSPEQAELYYAAKMMTPLQTMRLERFARWKQLFSDVTDGTRTIASTISSDGTGDENEYKVTVKGYAGKVDETDIVMPSVDFGEPFAFSGASPDADVLEILDALKNATSWMDYASNTYAAGLTNDDEVVVGGSYRLIMESAVLNAMDSVWRMSPTYKGLSISARQYIREFLAPSGGALTEIDAFASLPTATATEGKRLVATLIDSEAPREFVHWEDVEPARCYQERSTSYNYQGEGVSGIFKGLPSYALIAPEGGGA